MSSYTLSYATGHEHATIATYSNVTEAINDYLQAVRDDDDATKTIAIVRDSAGRVRATITCLSDPGDCEQWAEFCVTLINTDNGLVDSRMVKVCYECDCNGKYLATRIERQPAWNARNRMSVFSD